MADVTADTAERFCSGDVWEGWLSREPAGGCASPLCSAAPRLLGPRVPLHAGGLLDAQRRKLEQLALIIFSMTSHGI